MLPPTCGLSLGSGSRGIKEGSGHNCTGCFCLTLPMWHGSSLPITPDPPPKKSNPRTPRYLQRTPEGCRRPVTLRQETWCEPPSATPAWTLGSSPVTGGSGALPPPPLLGPAGGSNMGDVGPFLLLAVNRKDPPGNTMEITNHSSNRLWLGKNGPHSKKTSPSGSYPGVWCLQIPVPV